MGESSKTEEEITAEKEESRETVEDEKIKESEEVEEITSKSFSDYFTEVNEKSTISSTSKPVQETVIPPIAVDLHKEITGGKVQPPEKQSKEPEKTPDIKPAVTPGKGNGYSVNNDANINDDSYYIWYKDSEPNAVDTQTMSYEYELLYQATKEAEYKSKLRIYVTTFILFFSIVLLLLIFSPVIYKYFFSPQDDQSNEEYLPEPQGSADEQSSEFTPVNPPVQNSAPVQENKVTVPPVDEQKSASQDPVKQNSSVQAEQKTPPPPVSEKKSEPPASQNPDSEIKGVVKTNLGWMDDKNKVIYIQLENGMYTIQESAWDTNEKASKRIEIVTGYNIPGLRGIVFKADLGSKGIWYRTRFGQFSTIEEARQKAIELRNKEKMKLHAFLFSILMVT